MTVNNILVNTFAKELITCTHETYIQPYKLVPENNSRNFKKSIHSHFYFVFKVYTLNGSKLHTILLLCCLLGNLLFSGHKCEKLSIEMLRVLTRPQANKQSPKIRRPLHTSLLIARGRQPYGKTVACSMSAQQETCSLLGTFYKGQGEKRQKLLNL